MKSKISKKQLFGAQYILESMRYVESTDQRKILTFTKHLSVKMKEQLYIQFKKQKNKINQEKSLRKSINAPKFF